MLEKHLHHRAVHEMGKGKTQVAWSSESIALRTDICPIHKRCLQKNKISADALKEGHVHLCMKSLGMLCLAIALTFSVKAGDLPQHGFDSNRFFHLQIEPILERRCFECHSHQHKTKGGLALDSKPGWEMGGESGPAVKPGDLKNSPLVQAIRHLDEDTAMPPDEKLPAVEIALLETWVMLGAPDPRDRAPVSK